MFLNLNIYGSRFTFGLQGENAIPVAPAVLLEFAASRGFNGLEIPVVLLRSLGDAELTDIREQARARELDLVASTFGTQVNQLTEDLRIAAAIGAPVMVTACENTLFGGDRRPHHGKWQAFMAGLRDRLAQVAPIAKRSAVRIGLENHQDVDSYDLVWLCGEVGSPFLGVTFDCANGLGVAEHPVDFLRAVLPNVVHAHLKDYVVTWTAEGFQLLRCPTGAGIVPFAELLPILRDAGKLERASVEVGALVPRVVRAFADDFWADYEPRPPFKQSRLYEWLADKALPEEHAYKTPFELGASEHEIVAYEERELEASLVNARAFLKSLR